MSGRVQDKVCIVTGGSTGIGKASATALAKEGGKVVITARGDENGRKAEAEIRQIGGDALFIQQDAGVEADWKRVIEQTLSQFGRLDVLVNNAGVSILIPMRDMTLDQFRQQNTINLRSAFLGLKYGVEAMRKHGEGGSIIMMSSVLGKLGMPSCVAYGGTKGGMKLLAKSAALELGEEKIRVNDIQSGLIRTPLTFGQFGDEETINAVAQQIPMQDFGEPDDIANGVVFLASDESAFMTGTELTIDGGLSAD